MLRVQDGGSTVELTDKFVSSDTIWGILRRFEKKNKLNFTERYASSATQGAGRLLYEMPAVRVVNRELVSFMELQQSLISLGVRDGKLLVVLRWKSTTIPYEEALEEVAKISPKEQEDLMVFEEASGSGPAAVEEKPVEGTDVVMDDTPAAPVAVETEAVLDNAGEGSSVLEAEAGGDGQSGLAAEVDPDKPIVSVYKPSESATPAAAQIDVPENAYDIGINEAKIIQHHLKKAAIGRRLPSDKEIEEKEAAAIAAVEKVQTVGCFIPIPGLNGPVC